MFRHFVALGTIGTFGFLFAFPVHAAGAARSPATPPDPAIAPGQIVTAEPVTGRAQGPESRPVYGPILSRDPQVRAQIKRLYLEQSDLVEAMRAELLELSRDLQAELDPDSRAGINRDVGQVKKDFQLQHMETGLAIARLNEDERRVVEFELALDQVRHPEKYRPERPAGSARVERSHR